jgi:SAM-dependent methyltransferase
MPKDTESLSALLWPNAPGQDSYCVLKGTDENLSKCDLGLPLPPNDLRLGYGEDNEKFLALADEHMGNMVAALAANGFDIKNASSILDFGCSNGRMMRRLPKHTSAADIWGVDVSAAHVLWAKVHLSPPFNFLVSTFVPHLPFEDHRFDLIYAGSVFTHIDDLALSWFSELARILSDDGLLYVTIHDENTVEVLKKSKWWLSDLLNNRDDYKKFIESDYGMFAIYRSSMSHVFYRQQFLRRFVAGMFDVLGFFQGAYSQHQTGIVLRKTSRRK